jgi:hypothetical protein
MQATQPITPPRVRKWQHLRILLGICIVCSGWGLLLQSSTQGGALPPCMELPAIRSDLH